MGNNDVDSVKCKALPKKDEVEGTYSLAFKRFDIPNNRVRVSLDSCGRENDASKSLEVHRAKHTTGHLAPPVIAYLFPLHQLLNCALQGNT